MVKKVSTIDEALDQIEKVDNAIVVFLDKEEYGSIIEILSKRLILISQVNEFKVKEGLSFNTEKRLKQIFADGNQLQSKIQEKQHKIGERLKKYRTAVTQNKKISY